MARSKASPASVRGKRVPLLVIVMHGKGTPPAPMGRAMTRTTIRRTKKPPKSKR
jgi:hypothetical protein